MTAKKETTKTRSTSKAPARETKYVDANNMIVGRLASLVAGELLRGESVVVINTEKAVFTGNPVVLQKLWQTRLDLRPRGNPETGPRFSRVPDRIVREVIEGMVPHRTQRGVEAMRRLKTFIGKPAQYEGKTFKGMNEAQNTKTKGTTTVLKLANALGYNEIKE
ncbi:MAG: 50S ribosomal protein L13 [Candidatus Diapherotrites archaeon]|uniref:Large ribosomal subunit protein uL13 n=1 Tax=Candidatus Iainarchaeum sp. TaxID=3101447 RepID=A0A8T4C673_9ARCH|nr:50S ribosomal protein L13 [Candidatus Diapherotrites archaeon]